MNQEPNKEDPISVLLLRESLWKIEDRVSTLMETQADQEAEIIRLKRTFSLLSERLDSIISRKRSNETIK